MDLKGKALSASMIKTFLSCPRKFQKRYVEKIRTEKASDHLPLGSAFHAAMEKANKALLEEGPCEDFTVDQKEDFLDTYRRLAVKLGLSNMSVFNEGIDLVKKAITRMNTDKIVLGVEMEFNIVTPDGVPIMGYIDLVEQISESEVLIKDFKTSRIAMSTQEAREDIQLAMYDFAASVMFPQFSTIWVELDYIRHDKPAVRVKRTDAQRQNFLKFLKAVYDEVLAFDPDPEVPGKLNEYCSFCDYNHGCSQYVTQLKSYDINLNPVESMNNSGLVTEYEELKYAEKAIGARLDQVKLQILQRMEGSDELIKNDEKEIYIQQGTTREQDVPIVVQNIAIEDLLEYGIINKVNNKALDQYFYKNPNKKLQMLIDGKSNYKFNNPSVRTKKTK